MTDEAAPMPSTVADGFSRTDERTPVNGPAPAMMGAGGGLDFNYDNDGVPPDRGEGYGTGEDDESKPSETGLDHHLPNPDRPVLEQTHMGEHRGDHGEGGLVPITSATRLFAFCAALNSCNLGYDIGVNTDAAKKLQDSMDLSDVELEIFMGSLNLFAMVGALGAHWVSDRFGRRGAFIVAAIGFIIGVIIMATSQSYGVLMFGRVFVGLGVGFGLAIDPVYISEISPASHRGQLVTWSEIATNVGILFGFCSGLFFYNVEDDKAWRAMFGLGAILPAIMIYLASFVMPESPRWLVSNGRDAEAAAILQRVYPDGYDVEPVVADIKESLKREEAAEHAVGWDVILFPTPAFRRMLLVGLGTAVAQQAVGIDAIQYFLVFIIDESGIKTKGAQSAVLIFLGVLKLGFIVFAGNLFDYKGRRPLFFVSLCGMAVALLLLSFNFYGDDHNSGFAVFGLAVYLSCFSFGMGPGAWLVPSEVFSTSIRAKAMSVATFLNRVAATLMSSTFLSTAHAMSWAGFFLLLAGICMIILLFLYIYLPETKGRSLEDMSVYFAEITGDRSILDVEETLRRQEQAASETPYTAEPTIAPPSEPPVLEDANVVGTMA